MCPAEVNMQASRLNGAVSTFASRIGNRRFYDVSLRIDFQHRRTEINVSRSSQNRCQPGEIRSYEEHLGHEIETPKCIITLSTGEEIKDPSDPNLWEVRHIVDTHLSEDRAFLTALAEMEPFMPTKRSEKTVTATFSDIEAAKEAFPSSPFLKGTLSRIQAFWQHLAPVYAKLPQPS